MFSRSLGMPLSSRMHFPSGSTYTGCSFHPEST